MLDTVKSEMWCRREKCLTYLRDSEPLPAHPAAEELSVHVPSVGIDRVLRGVPVAPAESEARGPEARSVGSEPQAAAVFPLVRGVAPR